VSVDYVQHNFVLSLAALRRLCFVSRPGKPSKADRAVHAALAALGLAACLGQDQLGYAIRSRCDLVPEVGQSVGFELMEADGTVKPLSLDLQAVCTLFGKSVEAAASEGIAMRESDLVLQPQEKLLELVRRSRQQALRGEAEPEE
jgi:CRISPR-associated protein Csb1